MDLDPNETAGGSLVIGYLLVIVALYRSPASALEAATATPQTVVFFAVLPVLGLAAGAYAYVDGPYSGGPVFLFGSYLGLVGIALTLGALLGPTPLGLTLAVGVVVLALAVVALVASLKRAFGGVGAGLPGLPSD